MSILADKDNPHVLDLFNLTGKVALVTGGARSLGRQHVLALAEAGADIAFCDLLEDEGTRTRDEIIALGRRAFFGKMNVRVAEEIEQFLDKAEESLGPIDILVNNAARPSEGIALHEVDDDLWRDIIDTNLSSVFYVSKRVVKRMITRKQVGNIISIASINAFVISNILPRHNVTYCVSKAGLVQLTKGMAADWAPYNIRVNAIAPGPIYTEQTAASAKIPEVFQRNINHIPMERYGNLDELKGAIVYLASDASSFVTGTVVTIDGGYTVW
jgi:NAD(P)-dependent dehydrogenase (short-subunit alcohol dehydrogenase family)